MLIVRLARHADLEHLAQFWYERAALTPLPVGVALLPDARDQWQAAAARWLSQPDYRVLAAEDDGELAGFAAARAVEAPPGFAPAMTGEILAFALDGHAHHPGAGRALADALHLWLRDCGISRVCVTVPKGAAVEQAFWRSMHGESWTETLWWTW